MEQFLKSVPASKLAEIKQGFLVVLDSVKHNRYFYRRCSVHVITHPDFALLAGAGKMEAQPSHHTPLQPLRSWRHKRCPKRRRLPGGAEQRQADSSKGQRRPPRRIHALTWSSRKVRRLVKNSEIWVRNGRSLSGFSLNVWNNYAWARGSTNKLMWLCLHSNDRCVFPEDGTIDWFASLKLLLLRAPFWLPYPYRRNV